MPRLELVGIRHTTLPKSGAKGYKAALNSIVHNAEVYDFAASTASLTFSLMVTSSPQGATISYKQRGDDHYAFADHVTDWKIENLTIGNYLIRAQLKGYEDNEVPFNAGKSSIPSVSIPLIKMSAAKKKGATR